LRLVLALAFTVLFFAVAALGVGTAYALYRRPQLAELSQRVHAELTAQASPWVPLSQIQPMLPRALLATEDNTFWTNIGISFEGIARSVLIDFASGSFVEGGSTITQQLVRDQLLSQRKTIPRKLEEMVLAIALTRMDSKREILALYLNQVYFGHGAYGIAAASRVYFGRTPALLDDAQCTLLAGLPQAPSLDDPLENPTAAHRRQAEVIGAMEAAGGLTRARGRALLAQPWQLR